MKKYFVAMLVVALFGISNAQEQPSEPPMKKPMSHMGKENPMAKLKLTDEQKKQMKFKEATKGKGMRTLFRKAGFQTYLVDEFRTSCMCSKCEIGICKK